MYGEYHYVAAYITIVKSQQHSEQRAGIYVVSCSNCCYATILRGKTDGF